MCTCDENYKKLKDTANHDEKPIYKRAKLRGFSLFCDWENVGQESGKISNDVDLDKLLREDEQRKRLASGQVTDPAEIKRIMDNIPKAFEFDRILKNEFGTDDYAGVDSDDDEKLMKSHASHKYLIENFTVTVKLQLNQNI